MSADFLQQSVVYLGAALVLVPLAARLGLGSVLGYLLAGLLIGPSVLGWVGSEESGEMLHFAEFGVVLMLFLVGLELEPATLWRLRTPIVGLGGLQVVVTAGAVALAGLAVGFAWTTALAVGLIVAMSSTAIGLQSLGERGLLKTDAGQKAFAVLLFQDVAVIPILALMPLLATASPHHGDGAHHGGASWLAELAPLPYAGVVLGAILAVIALGRIAVRPALRGVAAAGMRELFTAAALLIVVGVTLLMTLVGLSPALGTFLAGVVLANSEFRHELESDIEPFKGLLLGLFFMAVGASIDVAYVRSAPGTIAGALLAIVAIKLAVLVGLGRVFGGKGVTLVHLATGLGQIGEFAFVLVAFAASNGVLSAAVAQPLVAITALSMALAPLLIVGGDRVLVPWLSRGGGPSTREHDAMDERGTVIIAGYGRFGQVAGRFLRAHGVHAVVLDVDIEQVELLQRFGQHVYYGDASRLDLLHAAGGHHARLLIVAVDEHAKALDIVHNARAHFPQLQILARARGRTEAYELLEAGVEYVYRETFDTALRVGEEALRMLGVPGHRAHRAARTFRHHDEATVREMVKIRDDRQLLVRTARERLQELENILRIDMDDIEAFRGDPGWDDSEMRKVAQRPAAE
jgi:monovalent cation:proton antiporter-2 (CPA2) family protein